MAARFPELLKSGMICQQEPQKGSRNFPNVFRPYLKERELDEDQLVSSKAKFCFVYCICLARKRAAPSSRMLLSKTNSVIE